MKIFVYLLQILIIILAVVFLVQHHNQLVDIKILWFYTIPRVQLWAVILFSFTAGAVVAWMLMSFYIIRTRSETRALKHKNRQLLSELESLRNISLEEIPEDAIPETPPPAPKPLPVANSESQES
ncbi:MAG: LapA family protein [Calditrichaeota bacterium]|nr:MAG: LapA family protein [Calditrichota bacterium]